MSHVQSGLPRRTLAALTLTAAAVLTLAGPASAHVTVAADDGTRGAEDAILTFRVPNEEDAATTTKVEIAFPSKDPIASVKPAQVPGWTVSTTQVKFSPPITTDDGTISSGVGTVTYTADKGTPGIPAGGFGAFPILVGPLPDAASVAFPTVQTYSDGTKASWIEPVLEGQDMPENPTPVLDLAAKAGGTTADGTATTVSARTPAPVAAAPAPGPAAVTSSDLTSARTLGLAGLVAGLLGLLAGGAALARSRRPRSAT